MNWEVGRSVLTYLLPTKGWVHGFSLGFDIVFFFIDPDLLRKGFGGGLKS